MANQDIDLIEIFASVQGETSFTGLPTTFVRLAKCNLRCSWCDTTYSFKRGTPYTEEAICKQIDDFGCRHVCITGGEPLLQENVYSLISRLCDNGYIVSVETGGSLSIARIDKRAVTILDVKCPASGMSSKNYLDNLKMLNPLDEVKFVVQNKEDYSFAKDIAFQYRLFDREKQVLFSPVFGMLDPKILVAWILEDKIPARLNLQTHKYIWSPDTKGV